MEPGHTDVTVRNGNSPEGAAGHTTDRCLAVGSILARIGDKWSMLVVMSLGDGTFRFNELKRHIGGISQRMLTLTLRGLERDGLVERTFVPTIPPKVSYALTELGRSLRLPVGALGEWAVAHRGTVERSRERYDRISGQGDGAQPLAAASILTQPQGAIPRVRSRQGQTDAADHQG